MPETTPQPPPSGGAAEDFSTSREGVVPLERRRPRSHFLALWITFTAGFTHLFLGFQLHDGGYSLPDAVLIGVAGGVAYLVYAVPAAYLGSSTGQTHALLTRSIFGRVGSGLASLLLVGVAAGWTAFAFTLLATLYDGLFGWGQLVPIAVGFALVGVTNNLFGFTGITAFARYLVAPLMIVWTAYLVVKGLLDIPVEVLTARPAVVEELPLMAAVSVAIGAVMWGNEPDTWRYGTPRVGWPVPVYAVSLAVGLVLFVAGGWMMAQLSGAGHYDFGPAFRFTVEYSLFGVLWLGALVATVLQIAINDGNYYEMTNGAQNVVGHLRGWRRWHTCLLVAVLTALLTAVFPQLESGFFTVAGWSSIALPCTTVVMCVDRFVLPRLLGIRRALEPIPSWRAAATANWPAIVSVLVGVAFGAWGLGLFPGQAAAPSWGLVPLEAWLIAGLLYCGLATVVVRLRSGAQLLGLPASTSPILGRNVRS